MNQIPCQTKPVPLFGIINILRKIGQRRAYRSPTILLLGVKGVLCVSCWVVDGCNDMVILFVDKEEEVMSSVAWI